MKAHLKSFFCIPARSKLLCWISFLFDVVCVCFILYMYLYLLVFLFSVLFNCCLYLFESAFFLSYLKLRIFFYQNLILSVFVSFSLSDEFVLFSEEISLISLVLYKNRTNFRLQEIVGIIKKLAFRIVQKSIKSDTV